jgi:hypothetical protein
MDRLTRPQERNNFDPPVRSQVVKLYGERKGVRLINYESLRAYLNGLPDDIRPRGRKPYHRSPAEGKRQPMEEVSKT